MLFAWFIRRVRLGLRSRRVLRVRRADHMASVQPLEVRTLLSEATSIAPVVADPVAYDLAVTAQADTPLRNGRLWAWDANGAVLEFQLVSLASHGAIEVTADGWFTYTPRTEVSVVDQFQFRVTDGDRISNTATVAVTVEVPINTAPVAYDIAANAAINTTLRDSRLWAWDAEESPLTYQLGSKAARGTVTINANGDFTYTPKKKFTGTDQFTFRVTDGVHWSNEATVRLTVIVPKNTAPVAYEATAETLVNKTLRTGRLWAWDAEGGRLTFQLVSRPGNGAVKFASNGDFSYMPGRHYVGDDQFTFRVSDGKLWSNAATVRLTVNETDPQPVPLGVYWPGEFAFGGDWERVGQSLDQLQQLGVNSVWITHLSAADTATFSRLAAARGISIVAALAELDGSVPHHRQRTDAEMAALAQEVQTAWGDAPRPLAWGLGDEPKPEYVGEMAAYMDRWKRLMPNEPTTVTVTPKAVDEYAGTTEFATQNAYVFRKSTKASKSAHGWLTASDALVSSNSQPWMMGQGFSLPGTYVRPTPEQMSWQVFSALATGARGFFAFCYRYNANLGSENIDGLVTLDGKATPQLTALGQSYRSVAAWTSILATARPASLPVTITGNKSAGNLARTLSASDGTNYLAVVRTFESGGPLSLQLPSSITRLVSVTTGEATQVRNGQVSVTLRAGEGELYRLVIS